MSTFEGQNFEMLMFEMARASAKTHGTSCVSFDICHRMASLRKLHSVISTYYFEVNILKKYVNVWKDESLRKNARDGFRRSEIMERFVTLTFH